MMKALLLSIHYRKYKVNLFSLTSEASLVSIGSGSELVSSSSASSIARKTSSSEPVMISEVSSMVARESTSWSGTFASMMSSSLVVFLEFMVVFLEFLFPVESFLASTVPNFVISNTEDAVFGGEGKAKLSLMKARVESQTRHMIVCDCFFNAV